MADHTVSPFTIAIAEEQLDDLDQRLRRTRFPQDFGNDDWRYGYNTAYHRRWSSTGSRSTTGATSSGG